MAILVSALASVYSSCLSIAKSLVSVDSTFLHRPVSRGASCLGADSEKVMISYYYSRKWVYFQKFINSSERGRRLFQTLHLALHLTL